MSTIEFFKIIQSSDFSRFIGCQNHLLGAFFQLIHIVGLLLVLSSIVLVSLRLLGIGLLNQPVARIYRATARLIWIGLGLLTFSGILIFIPAATNYYPNSAFWGKFVLLGLAILTHVTLYRTISQSNKPRAWLSRLTAVLSLSLWFSVAFAARFIGFV